MPELPPSPVGPPEPVDWLQLWAVGRYDLGLTDAELDQLTFTEFAAVVARHRANVRAADQRAALVPWALAQMNGHDVPIEAFMPRTQAEQAMERYADMMNRMAAWTAKAAQRRES